MRVIQTKNDTIRLIFNPKTDGLCLSDFLIVRDGKDNFLAQIVEIYDDKFNQEENVAVIKLVYRILPDYQVVPYDNFTPSRECEIAKIKPEEIEKCLNIDKATVPFGISTKNNRIVEVNIDFFNNNPVVFADKLDEVNCAFENIAQKLKSHKKVVAIDYTGNLNIKNSKRIKALDDFKLPLDYYSLDYIWEKALKEATPEAESELQDMFVELKKFADSTEDKYIPFPRFVKVIEQQYKITPAPELRLLLTRLRKYSNEGLFSRSKKEFQAISKAMQKESAIIIDFSNLKLEWHKEFLEFAVRQIREYDAYLLLRLNENNSNPELINNLYLKNPKLNIISSISYGFVKMPQVMEFARNYILYKTLNPRRDFGFANFQIASLNSSSFLIFGKDTMDFMFTMKNYVYDEEDLKKAEDKKIYIDLNLELEEMTSVELLEGNFDLKNVHIQNNQQKRLADEVAIDDILPGYEQNQKERLNNIQEQNLPAAPVEADKTADSAEDELQDVPLVDEASDLEEKREETPEENAEINAAERKNAVEAESKQAADDNEEPLKEEPLEAETTDTQAVEETETEEVETEAEIKEEAKEEIKQEPAPEDSNVAELIEASLKNDEAYIKEMADNKKADEIPLNEDELDYFVNPETAVNEETAGEEVITTEMIKDAVDNENLADELEAQVKNDNSSETEVKLLKKNLESDEEILSAETIKENTKEQETKKAEIKENPINPVAKEPEMIKDEPKKEAANIETKEAVNKAPLKEEAPIKNEAPIKEEVVKEETVEKEALKTETLEETSPSESVETLENIKEEAQNVLEKESIQKVLDANLPEGTLEQDETKTEARPIEADELKQTESDKTTEEVAKVSPEAEIQPSKTALPAQKKQNPNEAIIIVKEKPNLLIDDFSEPETKIEPENKVESESKAEPEKTARVENPQMESSKDDGVSLKELAKKSIEARFDEVMDETKKPNVQKKNQLKINENVTIDIDSIKSKDNSTQSSLPIFNNNEDEEEAPEYDFVEGMKVSHEKYGEGSILKVVKYSNRCLLQIEFTETGKRLLDPKIAKIKPVQ